MKKIGTTRLNGGIKITEEKRAWRGPIMELTRDKKIVQLYADVAWITTPLAGTPIAQETQTEPASYQGG